MTRIWLSLFGACAVLLALAPFSIDAQVNIVPQPFSMTVGTGTLVFGATNTVAIFRDPASDSTLPWVEKLFRQIKIPTTRVSTPGAAKVVITMAADANLGAEGYKMSITSTQVIITAPTLTGQFYGVQTLRQMFPAKIEDSLSGVTGPVTLSQLEITDKPRFQHRGFMLDPVRKFCPLPYLFQHIDRLALYKCNRLHLLISNDQGYRLESKVYPLLHEKGSVTNCGGQSPPAGTRWYYTQDEMRAVVKYAALRKIQVFPEIDMPGHCTAMCFCYPNLGTPNNAIQTSEDVGLSIMNTTPYVFTFCATLWREMATIFPYDQYQIGGDECFNISAANFKAFALRIQDSLAVIGKRVIAWDEVGAAGALRAGNWSQDWHPGVSTGDLMSSCTYLYLDMANQTGDPSTNSWCTPQVTLQNVYSTPIPGNFKGLESTLFTEKVNIYPDYWDRQSWPRQAAVAEVGWAPSNSNYNGFVTRITPHGSRFAAMGVKYYKTSGVSWGSDPVNTRMTSLYDNFTPVITPDPTSVIVYNSHRTPRFAASNAYTVYDLRGRVVGTSSGHGLKNATKANHGIYVVGDHAGNARTMVK